MPEFFVGHIRHPRPGRDFVYIGRTMNRFGLRDVGWGNPFRPGDGRGDPIDNYEAHVRRTPSLLRRLPELLGKDLLCWCKKPGDEWADCHGEALVKLLREWQAGTLVIPGRA